MPKGTSKSGTNWGVEVTKHDPTTGKVIYKNGKPEKVKIQMGNTQFANGTPQLLYFPEGHECAGVFKGMVVILEEQGFAEVQNLHVECPKFKCPLNAQNCCCHQLLYNELDFANVKTILETTCQAQNCDIFFLPKFH